MMMSPAMSPNYAAQKFSLSFTDIQLIILVVGLFEFLLFHFLSARKRIHTLLSAFHPSIQPQPSVPDDRGIVQQKRSQPSVSGGDVDVVLRSLGMFVNGGGAKLPASLDAEDLFEMFEDENPSLEEVKEAFNVFDEDRDGFIDAEELQNVLCSLGLKEGLKIDNCRRMIASVDEDGDGRIDFDEFVRFMERNLC